jgi:hypothetical protein
LKDRTEFIKERDLLSARSGESVHEEQLESKFTNRDIDEDRPIYDELFKKLKKARQGGLAVNISTSIIQSKRKTLPQDNSSTVLRLPDKI